MTEMRNPGTGQMEWARKLVAVLCLLTALASIFQILRSGRYGWDYDVYCGSIKAVQAGLDPYYAENSRKFVGNTLVLPYPLGALVFLGPACIQPRVLYPALCAVLLAGVALWAWRLGVGDPWMLAALLSGGFAAASWNFYTGNTGIIELLAVAAALHGLVYKRHGVAGLALGLVSAVKLTPLGFAVVFGAVMLRDRTRRELVVFGAGLVAGFATIHVLSLLIGPAYEYSYVLQVTGLIPNQHAAIRETSSDASNPTLLLLLKDILKSLRAPKAALALVYGLLLAAVAWQCCRIWRRDPDPLTVWAFGMLLACLLLPRLKPYSFTYALLPVAYLSMRLSPPKQMALLGVGCLVALWHLHNPFDALVSRHFLKGILRCSQLLTLLAVTGLLLWWHRARWDTAPAVESRPAPAKS
jgi:hypothetical protein